ncbi:3-hydroxyphenylpropionic transporter MhpT [Burkholderia pseudomallei]|uniref:3-(3-hydroxy-phenyl)propionate transporter MhpT n=1 Tax=Burkholderia pseudomallei TaxID=28450 RepID=UPI000F051A82|nr:3-(3-hydroxy-phenyl)propionate transporter MhpT [Burkholderia pseudomallei]CAJ2772870.1 3-hydroxyphenylpropionic transporter MhpT [Burkholderia pseudomallei]CAJ2846905.1 3-hydroxyphenylpropionic transporter MhpT [Burkholderia pseudomallei]CAJ6555926.1 3-hydroxyphenylpropionic transporter MhpT [Burkholderia pseudomallei]CAJ7961131.1 3-hydroxyphenylpropionic transporter MhpT [Burkholderia pseudomallei]CAJ8864797.1 3-hydroxyphenylpropionic transporter MhpT [Burkholderia pseudomallei]
MDITVTEKRGVATTLALCFAIALLEGLDLQSVGVAAPRMAREFGLSVAQMGWAFGAGTFGLLPGALLGGRLADRIGRKRVLIVSVCTFGLLSIATAQASSFAMLVVVRVLTGVGLGGAMPNLIALSSEAVEPRLRGSAVSAMYCGIPFGGVIASAIGVLLVGDAQWRHIFYVGGLGPLLLVPLLARCLPESRAYLDAARMGGARPAARAALFGGGRACATLALWVSYFCTLIVLYFLLNWLPSLMAARGLGRAAVGAVQIGFNVGGGLGASRVVGAMYAGIVASLVALALAPGFAGLAAAAFAAGMFVIGGQSVLYALAASHYPAAMRGTGVGAAVAAGRIGSVVGPLAAAQLLAMGRSGAVVIGASIPVTLLAAAAALLLVRRPPTAD